MIKVTQLFNSGILVLLLSLSVSVKAVERIDFGKFLEVNINDKAVDLSSELPSITGSNTIRALNLVNNKANRRKNVVNPLCIVKTINSIGGVSFHRLDDVTTIDYILMIDDSRSCINVVDSKNEQGERFSIRLPRIRRKKGFPWFKIKMETVTLWSYSYSKTSIFGSFGEGSEQFKYPSAMTSDRLDQENATARLWITDAGNDRLVQLKLSRNGELEWVNTVGNFKNPQDIIYVHDSETPYMYVANTGRNSVVRLPVTDQNYSFCGKMTGFIEFTGESDFGGFQKPVSVCMNASGDKIDSYPNEKYLYIADAFNRQIYQYKEMGNNLIFLRLYDLPELDVNEFEFKSNMYDGLHVDIKSDQFGRLFVADKELNNVTIFSQNLEKLADFGSYGDHSNEEIYFNRPSRLYITSDNLYVVDRWGPNSGMQRFDIGGIEITNAAVDVPEQQLKITTTNAFDRCTYSVNDGEEIQIEGLTRAGTSVIDISDALQGLENGECTLTVTVRSAFSRDEDRLAQKDVSFIIDPDAYRQPRYIQIETTGRRVDVSWEPPHSPGGLAGYNVSIGGEEFEVPPDKTSFTWYASRTASGANYPLSVGAAYLQEVDFVNVHNFNVAGNSIEHTGTGNASAQSAQQLTQEDWDNMPIGGKWMTTFTLDFDPDELDLDEAGPDNIPNILLNNTPIGLAFVQHWGIPVFKWLGIEMGSYINWDGNGTRCVITLEKTQHEYFNLEFHVYDPDGTKRYFPLGSYYYNLSSSVGYFSNYPGMKLSDCFIGSQDVVSNQYFVNLRNSGNVDVGNRISLDDAVKTAFNDDRILLPQGTHQLSVPLNVIPEEDNNLTPVEYSIIGNTSSRATIKLFGGNEKLLSSDRAEVEGNFSLENLIILSENPMKIINSGTNLGSYDINFEITNSIIDVPQLTLVKNEHAINGSINMDFTSNTLVMEEYCKFIKLNGFDGFTLTMDDNFIINRNEGSIFCFFSNNETVDLCASATIHNNAFAFFNEDMECLNSICTPDSNEITTLLSNTRYLNQDYSVTNLNHPAVVLNADSTIQTIRGAVKTFKGRHFNDPILPPVLSYMPDMLPRTNPAQPDRELHYLPNNGTMSLRLGLSGTGTITVAHDKEFTTGVSKEIQDASSYITTPVVSSQLCYVYGKDSYGIESDRLIFSFPGRVLFEDQNLDNFYGAPAGQTDVFKGDTSSDAVVGGHSWKIESQPLSGGTGYETTRCESIYEPLPDVTNFETFSFYYKKQYTDQEFAIVFEDQNGTEHVIRNTPLESGERGWVIDEGTPGTDWRQAVVVIRDQEGLDEGDEDDLPMSGKLMRMTVSFNNPSSTGATPGYLLLDGIRFTEPNFVLFDEDDPSDFTGTGGTDGWDGLTLTDAFSGSKSYMVRVKPGNTITSDYWEGMMVDSDEEDLPLILNKKMLTFSYKKLDPNSRMFLRLNIENQEDETVTVFEIAEQNDPADMNLPGWALPRANDSVWHQVFIDLFSVSDTGNMAYPDDGEYPYGQVTRVELGAEGTGGSVVLFDDIEFIQNFSMKNIGGSYYFFSESVSRSQNNTGWKVNSLAKEYASDIIFSYGTNNNVSVHLKYGDMSFLATEEMNMAEFPEIEKPVSLPGTEFDDLYLIWKEEGYPASYIILDVECDNGEVYPLSFSPYGFNSGESRGKLGIREWQQNYPFYTTKYSYSVKDVFEESYPELSDTSSPVSPVTVSDMRVAYKPNVISEGFVNVTYPCIRLGIFDGSDFIVTLDEPPENSTCGNQVGVTFETNQEIMDVRIEAIVDGRVIRSVDDIINSDTANYNGSIDLSGISNEELGEGGAVTIRVIVKDIYGREESFEREVTIDRNYPSVLLTDPLQQIVYNEKIMISGITDLPCVAVHYTVEDQGNILGSGTIDFDTPLTEFSKSIDIESGWPEIVNVTITIESQNGQTVDLTRVVRLNPSLENVIIGTVTNQSTEWSNSYSQKQMCGASDDLTGNQDNVNFGYVEIAGNFEVTVRIKEISDELPDAKAGIMVRRSIGADDISAFMYLSGSHEAGFIYRLHSGAASQTVPAGAYDPGFAVLRLKRIGTKLSAYISNENLHYSKVHEIDIGTVPLLVGTAYTSGDAHEEGCVVFDRLHIETFSDYTGSLTLGCYNDRKVLPTLIQQGSVEYIEDKSTMDGGSTINISGTVYSSGIGGKPQTDGSSSFLIYNLENEAKRFNVDKFLGISGVAGNQNGSGNVTMFIKGSNSCSNPSIENWLNSETGINDLWSITGGQSYANINNIDLTGVRWLGFFISSDGSSSDNRHGVWADLVLEFSGTDIENPPEIITHPQDKTVAAGQSATFTVIADGSEPLNYRWQKNYMDIPGSNSASYTTPPLNSLDNNASYRCLVTNNLATVVSNEVNLTVIEDGEPELEYTIIAAGPTASFADRVKIVGPGPGMTFNGDVTFTNDDSLLCNINATGSVTIGDRSFVDGDIRAGGTISLGNQGMVTGEMLGGHTVSYVDLESITVNPGTENKIVSPNGFLDLAPGTYDSLHAFANCTILFHTGEYHFGSFILEPDASVGVTLQFVFDEDERIDIYVEGETKFGDRTIFEITGSGSPSQLLFYSNTENIIIGTNSNLTGRFIAPDALVDLGSNTLIEGIVHAQTFNVHPDVTVNSSSLFDSEDQPDPPDPPEHPAHPVLGFENSGNWSFTGGAGTLSDEFTVKTEGNASMKVEGNGWQKICSVALSTQDISPGEGTLLLDLYIGTNQPNPYWIGEMGVSVHCVSAGINEQIIGTVQLTNLPQGEFSTASFTLPSNVIDVMNGDHEDFKFLIILNTNQNSGPYYLDNMLIGD